MRIRVNDKLSERVIAAMVEWLIGSDGPICYTVRVYPIAPGYFAVAERHHFMAALHRLGMSPKLQTIEDVPPSEQVALWLVTGDWLFFPRRDGKGPDLELPMYVEVERDD